MNKCFVGFSNDLDTRKKATSGGVGSQIIKYLFGKGQIKQCVSFQFNRQALKYEPRLINNIEDYEISGSIYHEIELIKFIKENRENIEDGFACFALPCQVTAIRSILKDKKVFIIELTCSSQQSYAATEYLLKRVDIKKEDIRKIQYRGNGWPSGIQIKQINGETCFIPNNNSIWRDIFHSKLFIMPRCFVCNPDRKSLADIVIADPWGIDSPLNEKVGRTLFRCLSTEGYTAIKSMHDNNIIELSESSVDLYKSQNATIVRKRSYLKHNKVYKNIMNIIRKETYRRFATSNTLFFRLHCSILKFIEKIYS